MRHQLIIFLTIGIIIFFALLRVEMPTPTGATIVKETENTYAIGLRHVVNNFFGVGGVQFPQGSCGDIARELYANLAYTSFSETSGFKTTGTSRLATVSFDIEPLDTFGTVDMAKGDTLLNGDMADGFISINAEALIRVPKEIRSTYLVMDLYGNTDGFFTITRGQFSTPSVDCYFTTRNGQAICDCEVHRIYGIRTGGITALRPLPEPQSS